jgi:sulfhydrogenase subunit beta (sulfur reductase)
MEKILHKKSFPKWVEKLDGYEIYTPVKKENYWSYEIINSPGDIELDFPNANQAPKKIINPQREVFLEFSRSEEDSLEVIEVLPEEKSSVIFGVRPCDAKALLLTDLVFSGDIKDGYYGKRRKQTAIVGLSCNAPPSPNCFCTSVDGSPHSQDGFDILLTDLGDRYFVNSLTKTGNELINLAKSIFTAPKDSDKKELTKIHTEADKKLKRQVKDVEKIPPKLKEMFESSFWDEESMSCLRCGICTYLCPTCHCFDISDEVTSVDPFKGYRIRTWDNCQFPDFTMHSSGHNPRPDKASRLRQRIMHKYQYFVERYQKYQCTGCGRCVSKCPVGIDIIEVLNKVRDYG